MSVREEILRDVDPQAGSVLLPDISIQDNEPGALPATFLLGGQTFSIETRLTPHSPFDGKVAERYLATDASGNQVCLSVFPADDYLRTNRSFGEAERWRYAHECFLHEPQVLVRLEAYERAIGTHYFPRLVSSITNLNAGRPAYATEFFPGTSYKLTELDLADVERVADMFRAALRIGHEAGVAFTDLSVDDLRLVPTPDGSDYQARIIDFNASQWLSPETRASQIHEDVQHLDRLLTLILLDHRGRFIDRYGSEAFGATNPKPAYLIQP